MGQAASHQGIWSDFPTRNLSFLLPWPLLLLLPMLPSPPPIWGSPGAHTLPRSPRAPRLPDGELTHVRWQGQLCGGHCCWATVTGVCHCPACRFRLSSPLCILHCYTGLHAQHTSSKVKVLRISRQQQQKIKLNTETFWVRGPLLQHRSHFHGASPGLTCTVHKIYVLVEDTKDEQANKEMYIEIPGSDNEVL